MLCLTCGQTPARHPSGRPHLPGLRGCRSYASENVPERWISRRAACWSRIFQTGLWMLSTGERLGREGFAKIGWHRSTTPKCHPPWGGGELHRVCSGWGAWGRQILTDPDRFGATTIPAHQGVGTSTGDMTLMVSIRFSSLETFSLGGSGTRRGV